MTEAPETHSWPKAPVIYQIYPRSFRDSDGDGVGDLRGILEKLDHVAELAVDAIWISPFYPSPLRDGGYDVADHISVHPAMGTMADFEALVARAHALGLKELIGQVFNHTSTENPWFQLSAAGDPDYADFYVWADPKPDGTQPNNWLSQFGPPAWTWNHRRRQYYFHNFTADQPSLNLRNEAVQEQLRNIMAFWRARGVDGFRIDAVTSFLFDPGLADNPVATPAVRARVSGETFVPYTYQDHAHDILPGDGIAYIDRLRFWAGQDAYLLGEVTSGNKSVEIACQLAAPGRLDTAYTTDFPEAGGTAEAYADVLSRCADKAAVGWWLSSHDQPRHAGKAGDGSPRDVRFLATVLALSPGPVILYQGEELGLSQPKLPKSAVTDPLDLLYWPDGPGREGARVPLPWAEGDDRGFSTGRPWLPMDWPDGVSVHVQDVQRDSNLAFYRRAMRFRRDHRIGNMVLADWSHDGDVIRLSYDAPGDVGAAGAEVVLNFGEGSCRTRARPDLASSGFDGTHMPGRCAGAWLRR